MRRKLVLATSTLLGAGAGSLATAQELDTPAPSPPPTPTPWKCVNPDAPETDDGRALAEAYRLHVDRYYYPCSRGMYREVASMYVSDPRFRNNLDRFGDGVAAFLTTAAEANAG